MSEGLRDHYAILGVVRTASAAEIRRAYRRLALEHHPDRAGVESTAIFQRIAEAYAVLGEGVSRARYDAGMGGSAEQGTAGVDVRGVRSKVDARTAAAAAAGARLMRRLSRHIDQLIADGVARRDPGGVIELLLTPPEAAGGGIALLEVPLRVHCQTCGGIARPGGFWCLRCNQTGVGISPVTVTCAIDPGTRPGELLEISTLEAGGFEPLRVRLMRA
jgi:molecular chaperone DnaJ